MLLTHYDPRFCSVSKQKQPLTYVSLFRNLSRTGSTQKRKGGRDTLSLRPPYTQKETPGVPLDWVPRRFLPPYKQLVLRQACVRAKFFLISNSRFTQKMLKIGTRNPWFTDGFLHRASNICSKK